MPEPGWLSRQFKDIKREQKSWPKWMRGEGDMAGCGTETTLRERLRQHQDSLELWESGYLAPTEPDAEERLLTIERLKAIVCELEYLLKELACQTKP